MGCGCCSRIPLAYAVLRRFTLRPVDVQVLDLGGVTANDAHISFGHLEMFGRQDDRGVIGGNLERSLLKKYGDRGVFRSALGIVDIGVGHVP